VAENTALRLSVLIVDDEKNIRTTLGACLEAAGCTVAMAASSEVALATLVQRQVDLVFLDLRLGTESGLDLLPRLLADRPRLGVIVLTAYATFETAVEAIKRGAFDYLPKPFTPEQIRQAAGRFAAQRRSQWRATELEQQLRDAAPEARVTTQSPTMQAALDIVERAAPADAVVLMRGESGTGKGVLARLLHAHSPRRERPFVVVNCPTLSEELLASELFGHVKGSFTGAVRDQVGRVEAAEGGTLFLDEISEIAPGLQAKLLRFLQDRQFERLGENRTRRADVRVVAATNRDLDTEVKAGRFREDLLYRLNVVEVFVPALRERPEDIADLARGFIDFFARNLGRPAPQLSAAAQDALVSYAWPGNVRELRNTIERTMILWPGQIIEASSLPERMQTAAAPKKQLGGLHTLDEIEREHIQRVLARTATLDEAARVLGIDDSTLWRKRRKYEGA